MVSSAGILDEVASEKFLCGIKFSHAEKKRPDSTCCGHGIKEGGEASSKGLLQKEEILKSGYIEEEE